MRAPAPEQGGQVMHLIPLHSPTYTAPDGTRSSGGFAVFPSIAAIAMFFRAVPSSAVFTLDSVLIFINKSSEKVGEK
jgi:hypothetical protein